MPRKGRSTLRRYTFIESFRRAPLAMRPCDRYSSRGLEYRTSLRSDKCGECIRVSHPYSLVVTPQQFAAVNDQLEQLEVALRQAREAKHEAREKKQEARSRTRRLKAQRQKLLEKRSEIANRELRNIEELEVDEMLTELRPLPTSPTGFS